MDVGGRVTQEQLPSDSDAAIYNWLILRLKIACLGSVNGASMHHSCRASLAQNLLERF